MPIRGYPDAAHSQSVSDRLHGEAAVFLLLCFGNDLFVFGLIGKKAVVKVVGRAMNLCKFISIYGFHLHFDHFKILEDDVPEFMVEMVNVNNVLECCRLGKDIIFTEGQRIAADPVVVIAEQEIFCLGLVADGETAGTENLQLFFYCLKILVCHTITPYKQNALKCACVSTEA